MLVNLNAFPIVILKLITYLISIDKKQQQYSAVLHAAVMGLMIPIIFKFLCKYYIIMPYFTSG